MRAETSRGLCWEARRALSRAIADNGRRSRPSGQSALPVTHRQKPASSVECRNQLKLSSLILYLHSPRFLWLLYYAPLLASIVFVQAEEDLRKSARCRQTEFWTEGGLEARVVESGSLLLAAHSPRSNLYFYHRPTSTGLQVFPLARSRIALTSLQGYAEDMSLLRIIQMKVEHLVCCLPSGHTRVLRSLASRFNRSSRLVSEGWRAVSKSKKIHNDSRNGRRCCQVSCRLLSDRLRSCACCTVGQCCCRTKNWLNVRDMGIRDGQWPLTASEYVGR